MQDGQSKPCPVPHLLRGFEPRDRPFVSQTWVRSLADAPAYRICSPKDYFVQMQKRVDRLLESKWVDVVLATTPDDSDGFLGWIARAADDRDTVHMVYVKEAYRRMGLARLMVNHKRDTARVVKATHWGKNCETIVLNKPGSMQYCPSLLREIRHRIQPGTPVVIVKGRLPMA